MSNYKLVQDEQELDKFINFLPELQVNESYFLILICRKKWNPSADVPSATKLRREAVNSKQKIKKLIKSWEIESGSYIAKNGVIIEQDNLGVYIGYNPKSQKKAIFSIMKECLDVIEKGRDKINVKSLANDQIQSSNGTTNFMDIDVVLKSEETIGDIVQFIQDTIHETVSINTNIYEASSTKEPLYVKTSGGFHCLIPIEYFPPSEWYQKIQKHTYKSEIKIMSHDLMPMPGCNQGKFIPYIMQR